MLTESTAPVREPPEFCIAESAAPKPDELLISAGGQLSPHRSVALPCAMNASPCGQAGALDPSVVPIVPPLTRRAALSWTVPPLVFESSQSTWMPWIVASDGMVKPKPVHLRKFEVSPMFMNAAVA